MLYPVLLIDSDSISNDLHEMFIEKILGSNQVKIIHNGEEALKYIEKYYSKIKAFPHYIFIDINLPDMDGLDFIKILTKTYPLTQDINLILLTTSLHPKDKAMAMELQIDHYEHKPLKIETLRDIISFASSKKAHKITE